MKGLLAVLLIATLLLSGCAAENQGPGREPAKEIVIPSSLEPSYVFAEFINTTPPLRVLPFMFGEWSPKNMDPYAMPEGASEEGFLRGFGGDFPSPLYTKKNGETPNISDGIVWSLPDPDTGEAVNMTGWLVLSFRVLKYENTGFAEKSFTNISVAQELRDSTYNGVALKSGIHSLDYWEEDMWEESTALCYLIHSGCFIIYLYGQDDVARDALDRTIEAFGVESGSNQAQAGNTT